MSKVHFVKINNTNYPVCYTFSALAELEEAFQCDIHEVLTGLGSLSAKKAQAIILAGLNDGERIHNKDKAKVYEAKDLDEMFLGGGFYTYKQFVEILSKDSGMQRYNEDAENQDAKNQKARSEKPA